MKKLTNILNEGVIDKVFAKIIQLTLSGKSKKIQQELKDNPDLQKLQQKLDADIEQYKKHLNNVVIDDEEFIKTFFNM